jgi:hypothetical protein
MDLNQSQLTRFTHAAVASDTSKTGTTISMAMPPAEGTSSPTLLTIAQSTVAKEVDSELRRAFLAQRPMKSLQPASDPQSLLMPHLLNEMPRVREAALWSHHAVKGEDPHGLDDLSTERLTENATLATTIDPNDPRLPIWASGLFKSSFAGPSANGTTDGDMAEMPPAANGTITLTGGAEPDGVPQPQ